MHDQSAPDRLSQLRFLERVQLRHLEETRRWISAEERRQEEQQRGEQARPPTPDWVIDYGLNRDGLPLAVHVGDCHMLGKRARGVDAGVARRALVEGVKACGHCRPDTALGVLD
ncbi:DUF6233 domain-containing protein [Streptomyces sp. SID4982]|uniref:DUF6233 domain-containing protein n=1 Tax=Streptomyces sp. SID4982 TaxID=2690291 RepID=UPI00136B9266|nr:DUF6233 domain-containing protein [Streptomyces sp. SID4982]MYS15038.1 hypothetical protein [Streptomyces sp. SID4982]